MPKLIAFLPCDRVVIEQGTRNVSIQTILNTINVAMPRGVALPPNASIPMQWSICQIWQIEPGDTGRFESRAVLTAPDGQDLFETQIAQWAFEPDTNRHDVIMPAVGFPIGQQGPHRLRLLLKRPGEQDFSEVSYVLMIVKHETQTH